MLEQIKQNIKILYAALFDKRSPWLLKLLLIFLLAYILSPIDLIPDFIPVLGLLDEAVLTALVYKVVMKMIPPELRQEYQQSDPEIEHKKPMSFLGLVLVILIWLIIACTMFLFI